MKTIKDTPGRDLPTPNLRIKFGEQAAEESSIAYCEKNFPATCTEFKRIQSEQYQLFCAKQRNYGPSNISVGTALETVDDVKLSLTGLWFRLNDKIQRLKQLVILNQPDEVNEPIEDTYSDLSIYGIIALIVSRKKWGK